MLKAKEILVLVTVLALTLTIIFLPNHISGRTCCKDFKGCSGDACCSGSGTHFMCMIECYGGVSIMCDGDVPEQ